MSTDNITDNKALWLSIEEQILNLPSGSLDAGKKETSIQQIAGELDKSGYSSSLNGGHLLQIRWALDAAIKTGHPLMKDFNEALMGLGLNDVSSVDAAVSGVVQKVGGVWPAIKEWERKKDILHIVEMRRLDLLVEKAKELSGDAGIRFLISNQVNDETIINRLGISSDEMARVNAEVEAEKKERERVKQLLENVKDKSEDEKIRHLINSNVTDALSQEVGGFSESAITGVRKKMEEELAEKKRLEEEEAAKRAAKAAGPSIDEMAPSELIDYIDQIRDILEFSEEEAEIRTMCEQSSIPKALVEITINDRAQLDELEKKAEAAG